MNAKVAANMSTSQKQDGTGRSAIVKSYLKAERRNTRFRINQSTFEESDTMSKNASVRHINTSKDAEPLPGREAGAREDISNSKTDPLIKARKRSKSHDSHAKKGDGPQSAVDKTKSMKQSSKRKKSSRKDASRSNVVPPGNGGEGSSGTSNSGSSSLTSSVYSSTISSHLSGDEDQEKHHI